MQEFNGASKSSRSQVWLVMLEGYFTNSNKCMYLSIPVCSLAVIYKGYDLPLQQNPNDCGILVCAYAQFILLAFDIPKVARPKAHHKTEINMYIFIHLV